jgi:hypothetical protein
MTNLTLTSELKMQAQSWIARQPEMKCPDCDGDGSYECPECHGEGTVECDTCDGDGTCRPGIREFLSQLEKERGLLKKLRNGIPYDKDDWSTLEKLLSGLQDHRDKRASVLISIEPGEKKENHAIQTD